MRDRPGRAPDDYRDRTRVVLVRRPAAQDSHGAFWSQQADAPARWTESERLVVILRYSTIILTSVTAATILLFIVIAS